MEPGSAEPSGRSIAHGHPDTQAQATPRARRRWHLLGQNQQVLRRHRLARLRRQRQAPPADRTGQDQARSQGQARRPARGDQGRRPHPGHLHRQAVRRRLARLTRTRSAHHGHLPRPGREVDLSEDRNQEAGRLQGHRRRPVLQRRRPGPRQVIAGEDQEHAGPVDPPRPEVRPHCQERRRARRPAAGPARAPPHAP